jgi:hypothetical protein
MTHSYNDLSGNGYCFDCGLSPDQDDAKAAHTPESTAIWPALDQALGVTHKPDPDEPVTPVIFRMFEGECIALFPYEPSSGTDGGWTCTSYMHVGQHGGADPRIVYRSKRASYEQYQELKTELESDPYFYRLRVLRRFPADAYKVRQAKI